MTDDPIKLFVVVMSILLCVLAFVAYKSYDQVAQFEAAIEQSPKEAQRLIQHAAEVQKLTLQLKSTRGKGKYRGLIENALRYHSIKDSNFQTDEDRIPGSRGKEKRFKITISRSGDSRPLTREQISKFCRTVETDSSGILKTIELVMNRAVGKGGAGKAGTEDEVVQDMYTVTVVFGLRVLE